MKKPKVNHKFRFLNLRVGFVFILIVFAAMLIFLRPNQDVKTDQSIEVTGRATLTAIPDEFVFSQTYQFKSKYEFYGIDDQVAIDNAYKKGQELIAALKKLGVPERKIKTRTKSYDRPLPGGVYDEKTCLLTLTTAVTGRELKQKVEDYLTGTSPVDPISPRFYFSEQKQKELETKARSLAIEDARAKAELSAKKLGVRLGKIKRVADGFGFGFSGAPDLDMPDQKGPALHAGENEITLGIHLSFYLHK